MEECSFISPGCMVKSGYGMVGFQNKCLAMAIRLHKTRGCIESEGGSTTARCSDSSSHGDEKLLLTTHLTQSTGHSMLLLNLYANLGRA